MQEQRTIAIKYIVTVARSCNSYVCTVLSIGCVYYRQVV